MMMVMMTMRTRRIRKIATKKQVMMTTKQKLWLERGHPTNSGDDKEEGDDHDGDGIDDGHD